MEKEEPYIKYETCQYGVITTTTSWSCGCHRVDTSGGHTRHGDCAIKTFERIYCGQHPPNQDFHL